MQGMDIIKFGSEMYDEGHVVGYSVGYEDGYNEALEEAAKKLAEADDTILTDKQYYILMGLKKEA